MSFSATSLEQHLTRMMSLVILIIGCVTSSLAYYSASFEAHEFQDNNLRQIAALAINHQLRASLEPLHKTQDLANLDPEMRILLTQLNTPHSLTWIPSDLSAGFHTISYQHSNWRVFVRVGKMGERIAAVQPTDENEEIILHDTLIECISWLVLLPLLMWLTVGIVRRSLAPLHRLAHILQSHASHLPILLPQVGLAKEIIPFVQALNQQSNRIQQHISQQQRFIADASHELRTPLTALSLQAQNLAQSADIADMHQRLMPLMSGIHRAQALTIQMLTMARQQCTLTQIKDIEMSSWLRQLIAVYYPIAELKQQDLGLDELNSLTISSDSEILQTVLRNALDNALRHTQQGGEITLKLTRALDDCIIEVIDNGPGIPINERERVFIAFYRIDNISTEGSGLGLSIAQEAASRINGHISLHSNPAGNGLVFRLRLKCVINSGASSP